MNSTSLHRFVAKSLDLAWPISSRRERRKRGSRPRLRFETLEQRQLMSLSPASGLEELDSVARLAPNAELANYLIITADQFYEEVQPLARWKHKMGLRTYVAKMSEVGPTQEHVKNFIQDAYHWDDDADNVQLKYVLLVGDHENVPSWEVVGEHWHTDYEYARVDGTGGQQDVYADVAIGRLPGDTEAQITTMVNKVLGYERTPNTGTWYDDALMAGQFQDREPVVNHVPTIDYVEDRWFMEDIHRAADFLGGDFDFWSGRRDPHNQGYTIHTNRVWDSGTSQPLHYQSGTYPGRTSVPDPVPARWISRPDEGISDAINRGVGLVFHRDHGSPNGWDSPQFTTADVEALHNGARLPLVLSLNCQSGRFDDMDAFGEAWMRNPNGGAVAFIGAQRVSYSGLNDALHAGIFDSMWDDYDADWDSTRYANSWHVGEVLNYAKDRVFDGYGSSASALHTARLFNLFGDPEMMLRTEAPRGLRVTRTARLIAGQANSFTVTVRKGNTRVEGALVCLSKPNSNDYWVVTTDRYGRATFRVTPHELGSYDLVVTERNAVPYQGTVQCLPAVSVRATDATAKEGPDNWGQFVVTRTGPKDSSLAVTVGFTLGGTATAGTDYVLHGQAVTYSSVTIQAGQSSAIIWLEAKMDQFREQTEYAKLTLRSSTSYAVIAPTNAQIAIINTPYSPPRTESSPGVHTVNSWMHGDGFEFDNFVLTIDKHFQPTGSGPVQSPLAEGAAALSANDWDGIVGSARDTDLSWVKAIASPRGGSTENKGKEHQTLDLLLATESELRVLQHRLRRSARKFGAPLEFQLALD